MTMHRRLLSLALAALVRSALHKPTPRKPTKPTYSSKLKRLESKTRRSGLKSLRGKPSNEG